MRKRTLFQLRRNHLQQAVAFAVQRMAVTAKTKEIKEPPMQPKAEKPDPSGLVAMVDFLSGDDVEEGIGEIDLVESSVFASSNGRHAQAETVKIVGARLREGRELCGLTITVAAERLGIHAKKLAAFENVVDQNSIPLCLIARAAVVYDVTVDFIFGRTDDWETSARMTQEREVSAWLHAAWETARNRDMQVIHAIDHRVSEISKTIPPLCALSKDMLDAIGRLKELNPAFDDLRGGARLVAAAEKLQAAAQAADVAAKRLKLDMSQNLENSPKTPHKTPETAAINHQDHNHETHQTIRH